MRDYIDPMVMDEAAIREGLEVEARIRAIAARNRESGRPPTQAEMMVVVESKLEAARRAAEAAAGRTPAPAAGDPLDWASIPRPADARLRPYYREVCRRLIEGGTLDEAHAAAPEPKPDLRQARRSLVGAGWERCRKSRRGRPAKAKPKTKETTKMESKQKPKPTTTTAETAEIKRAALQEHACKRSFHGEFYSAVVRLVDGGGFAGGTEVHQAAAKMIPPGTAIPTISAMRYWCQSNDVALPSMDADARRRIAARRRSECAAERRAEKSAGKPPAPPEQADCTPPAQPPEPDTKRADGLDLACKRSRHPEFYSAMVRIAADGGLGSGKEIYQATVGAMAAGMAIPTLSCMRKWCKSNGVELPRMDDDSRLQIAARGLSEFAAARRAEKSPEAPPVQPPCTPPAQPAVAFTWSGKPATVPPAPAQPAPVAPPPPPPAAPIIEPIREPDTWSPEGVRAIADGLESLARDLRSASLTLRRAEIVRAALAEEVV